MKKKIIVSVLFLILFFLFPLFSSIASSSILINEILIEPKETVELINIGSQSADLSNWYIDDSGGKTYFTIPQGTFIYPNQCLVFNGNFNFNEKSQDEVRLFNSIASPEPQGLNLVDYYSYPKSLGENISFFRFPDGKESWSSGEATIGLFNQSKINCILLPTSTPIPVLPSSSPTPTLTIVRTTPSSIGSDNNNDYENIFISEAMVNPLSGEEEWVEFYNGNNFPVNLSNWYLDDIDGGGSAPKRFSLTINSKSYAFYQLSSFIFNNSGDAVRLLNQTKIVKDSFEYNGSQSGETWGRESFLSDKFCLQEASRGKENKGCLLSPENISTPIKQKILVSKKKASLKKRNIPYQKNGLLYYQGEANQNIKEQRKPLKNFFSQGEVLGFFTNKPSLKDNRLLLIKTLIFQSITYSFLTMIAIFLRMKR